MRFPPAYIAVWLATATSTAASTPLSPTRGGDAVEDETRTTWQIALTFVHQWLSKSHKSSSETSSSILVRWNGRQLQPLLEQESSMKKTGIEKSIPNKDRRRSSTGRILSSSSHRNKRRNLKGSKSKEKKSKAVKSSDLKVIRKKGSKAGDSSDDDVILCLQGTSQQVTDACALYNAQCCEGDRACSWNDDGNSRRTTVCQGACRDDLSCYLVAPGAYIAEYACQKEESCREMAKYSQVNNNNKKPPVYVGPRSCPNARDCQAICAMSETCQVRIGANACVGGISPSTGEDLVDTCSNMGAVSNALYNVYIGDDACTGAEACEQIGHKNTNLETIGIEKGACSGENACSLLGGKSTGANIQLLGGSCVGDEACTFVGYLTKSIVMGSYACTGHRSCLKIGYTALDGIVDIGTKACTSQDSCNSLGIGTGETVFISADACAKDGACFMVAADILNERVQIGELACSKEANECSAAQDPACKRVANIPKYATSCSG